MPFKNLVLPKQLQEYTIMNIEPIEEHEKHKFAGQGAVSKKVSESLLFRNKRFALNEMFQRNGSKFVIIYV